MLLDRGHEEVEMDPDPFQTALDEREAVSGRGVRVFFRMDDKVGVKTVRTIMESATEGVKTIIVSVEGPTPFTRKEWSKRVQFLTYSQLTVNITKHALVPRHELCAQPPTADVHKYPKILDTDPVCQWYDFPVGSLVKITRVFGGAEPHSYFRVVTAASA